MWGSLVLIIAAISASNARMMAEPIAANQTATNQTAPVQTSANQTAVNKTAEDLIALSHRLSAAASNTFTIEGTTYKYFDVKKRADWRTARTNCLELGGDLAAILSYGEYEKIAKNLLFQLYKYDVMWVGAKRQGDNCFTDWRWVSGEPLSNKFKKWYHTKDGSDNYPKNGCSDCVYMTEEGNYNEGNGASLLYSTCTTTYPYLCEIPETSEES